jgi:hypothetical protein
MEHFQEEDKKSTVTLEHQDHKNQALKMEHRIILEFWLRNRKINFRPEKSTKVNETHMVNSEINPECITFQSIHESPKHTRRTPFIG